MGIQGLLPLLKSIMSPIHIRELEGCCVAIDTYSWLHKGALSCSVQLCKALPTSRHIDYCMHRINMLRHYGVKPILVLDGGYLPMKGEQETKRARSRKENLARAIEHESSGNSAAAYECYQKAVDISPAIAHELIQVLKREGIQYIVAPYEADAQMAFLAITKQVDAVITEDSDLIAFGCPRIIYKMDKYGQGVEFQLSKLQQNKDLNFAGFTNNMLLEMCILNGCDYLPSLPGVGPKRAHALISKFKTFEKVIKHLRYSSIVVPQDYEKLFKRALLTFRHQRVYDSKIEDIVHLSNLPDNIDGDLDFLGPLMPQQSVRAIAKGELDPITKLPFQENNVQSPASETSYQPKIFRPESDKKKLDLPAQKNILTNYFCFASLEAKRQFKAPRVSPKYANSANESSPTARVQVFKEPIACKTDGSSKHSNDPVKSTDVKSSHNSTEIELTPEDNLNPSDAEQNPLEKSGNTFHKPCVVLRRNSYLQHMTEDENDSVCISNRVALKSSYFLDKSDDKSKKPIIRSSYFNHNKSSKTPKIDETGPQLVRDDFLVDDRNQENYCHDSNMKRKASPVAHTNAKECAQNKHARTETYTEAGADFPDNMDNSIELIQGEEKFGCNISHLGHYSDISGKSLDKFACTISSFKYKSSGSRASGLRAPLRDVNNTFRDRRPAADIDIGKFAYIPSNGNVLGGIGK